MDEVVVYWLDDGQFTLAVLESDMPFGNSKIGRIRIDLTKPPASHYVGKMNWFAADYVERNLGVVIDHASEGDSPGEWERVTTAIERLVKHAGVR